MLILIVVYNSRGIAQFFNDLSLAIVNFVLFVLYKLFLSSATLSRSATVALAVVVVPVKVH